MERPLLWHQGLFLQPQHFQLSDLYHASLLSPLQKYILPYLWGVARIEIRQAALGTGSFQLDVGEFVFPDMTYAVVPDNATVEPRKFDGDWVDGGKPFTVYLGIRRFNPMGENVTTVTGNERMADVNTRFISPAATEEARDLHENGPSAQVRRLKYSLKLLWETEKDYFGDFETIPIAQLERQGDAVVLSSNFIPPSLTMNASASLEKIIKEIRDQIAARGYQLEGYKRDRGIHTAEFGSRDMVFLLALRSLNRYIPQLFHITESLSHPWTVYGLLRQLIGELSSFSEQFMVSGDAVDGSSELPKYYHLNLWQCFSRAQSVITALLDEITAGPEYVFSLAYDGTYYSSELPPAIFEGRNRFYLVVQTTSDPKAILNTLTTGAKLSSRENLPILIVRALPGVGIEHLDRPPQELPRRANALYFQIDHNGDQFSSIVKGRNITLFWESAPEDLKIELMVVGRG
jgi:type VI secretion system protein ImpJ